MLKDILIRIAEGGSSVEGIADSLDVDVREVELALDRLLQQGYLREQESGSIECHPRTCARCPMRKGCVSSSRSKLYPRILQLTEKGEKALGES